ncbi:P-loop containing nucleoside triphosphate hydrolase [Sesbania bispinosa]|nr:P-loop containing nucleoside triphosphate hydrolase [Sesbania bispinosa]
MPPSGSLFLFDRKVLRYFRKDGHNWRKKKMEKRELSHIVLVHYREVKGTKTNFRFAKENEESLPYAQQTYKIMPNTEMDTSLSSSLHPHSYQVPSQTIDTSMNSAQASEYEEAESAFNNHASSEFYSFLELQRPVVEKIKAHITDSYCPMPLKDDQEKLPVIPGVNYIPLSQANKIKDIHNVGLTYEPSKFLGFSSWESTLESNAGSHHVPFQPSFPETQSNNTGINSSPSPGDEIMAQHFTISIAKQHGNGSLIQAEGSWQASGFNSLSISNCPVDAVYSGSQCEVSYNNCEQEVNGVDFQKSMEQCLLHPHKLNKVLMQNGPREKLLEAKEKLKSDLEVNRSLDGVEDSYLTLKKTLLDGCPAEEGLKKLDSFNQWMSKELGDVEESNKQSTSGAYWDEVESENGVGSTAIPSQVHLDTYVLDPSVSNDQLFSIIDYSPSWTFEGSEVKVLISGRFLRTLHDAEHCNWSCMFGEVEVQAEIIGNGVLCCHTPPHKAGRVPFYVTCSNRLACSEVREFDFRVNHTRQVNTAGDNRGSTSDTFKIRFGELLSLEHAFPQCLDSISVSEKSQLITALGYDWALEPTIVAGVNVNFRDINGWTALHWAAFVAVLASYFIRERTVASLISLGAAPGALTDPCPEYPSGRTPADLASANGHKGIAGYLAESFLSAHLKSLDLNRDVGEKSGAEVVQRVQEQNTAQVNDEDLSYELSLKDSLAAVCNATQAAALNVKPHKSRLSDEPVHAAATRIQNKFRSWKGRKEFLMIRQRIVKIQAHVRGHQVRKNCGKIIWSVGILEKVILRWRRKGSGLRGFKSEAIAEELWNKVKQTEKRLEKALARVKSMVQYPEARDQYHRLLNVVTEIQENQVKHDRFFNNSEETREFDNLIDLEALLDEDTFMPTAT